MPCVLEWTMSPPMYITSGFKALAFLKKSFPASNTSLYELRGTHNITKSDSFTADGISLEILQEGEALQVQEPWKSMENSGTW